MASMDAVCYAVVAAIKQEFGMSKRNVIADLCGVAPLNVKCAIIGERSIFVIKF